MKMSNSVTRATLLAAITLLAPLPAADWSQWRGPDRDGLCQETGLLAEWPEGGPKLLWKTDGLGGGYTTPSFADGLIYGMGYVDNEEVVWALEEATGKPRWETRLDPAFTDMGYAEGPRCTPTIAGDQAFVLNGAGLLAALNARTGEVLWRQHLTKDFGGKMMSGWGYSESPLVDGDQVVCTPGGAKGSVAAFAKDSGKLLWQSADITDDASYSSLRIAEFGGVRQYVQISDQSVYAVAANDGKLLWRADRKGRTAVIPTPIITGNLVYVTSGYGVGCNLFEVKVSGGKFSVEELYSNRSMVNHHGGVVLVDGRLYGYSDGKGWICQDLKTGDMLWNEKRALGKGAILYADGRLYLRDESGEGTMALIEASPKGYVEKGRFDQPDRSNKNSWPHPVIHDGRLYLRDQGVLLCYDVKAPRP
ncbi:MAG: PQQ-like beta-propeller repeat protein [Verrucomicrobiae bacterium]|nr:PQQ-like beta-propeller repeat protein [Verrucomicrobiae bacterium]